MGTWDWWWWGNPFGPGNETTWRWTFILIGILALCLIGAIPAAVFRVTIKNKLIDRRLRNLQYVGQNKGKFFRIDPDSGVVILRCGVFPGEDEEWILSDATITINPCSKYQKSMSIRNIPFSEISKLTLEAPHKHRKYGNVAIFRLWLDTGVPSLVLSEDRLPNEGFMFKSIGYEAAQEIERRYNEYTASRKNK